MDMRMSKSIWQNTDQNHSCSIEQLIKGYSEWIDKYVDQGWNAFLMTLMFKPLTGGHKAIMDQMNDEVDRVYSTFLTRVMRNPRSDLWKYHTPVLIAVHDRPVARQQKQKLHNVTINDGMHMHGILVVPWDSRLKRDVVSHFEKYRCT